MTCPVCGKPRQPSYRPFCSKRCADIDLGRWMTGSYRIPGDPAQDEAMPRPPTEQGEAEA